MQSISPLTLADITAAVIVPLIKLEIYYDGSWQTPEAIIGDTGGQLLMTMNTSHGGEDPVLSVIAGTWSAEVYNPNAAFHPLNPTTTYTDVFEVGGKVRLSTGLRISGTDYFWPSMYGTISRVGFDTGKSTVQLSGYDYSGLLSDYKLREYVDLNFGGTRAFALADGANLVSNGTFDVDLAGWEAYHSTITCESGGYSGKCLSVATAEQTDNLNQRAKTTQTGFIVGGRYRATFQVAKGTQNWKEFAFVVGTTEDASDVLYSTGQTADDGWTAVTVDFLAPATTLYIALEKSSPANLAAGSLLFDELTITRIQARDYPMTAAEYPGEAAATGCYLLRKQLTASPATYEDYFVNEDFTWDRAAATLHFVDDWIMPAAGTVFLAYVYETQAPEDVVFHILANSGRYANYAAAKADAIYAATGITIDRVGFAAGTSGFEAIRLLAERCNYVFYFRYDGRPVFQPKATIKAAGSEDLVLLKALLADVEYVKNDEELFNRVTLTGELQDRESKDDLGDKAALVGEASDSSSIAAHGEINLAIENTLWQDQATIDTAAAAFLAALKDPKGYAKFALNICPLPVEVGDTISAEIRIAEGIDVAMRGVVRDVKNDKYSRGITLEKGA